MKWIKVVNSLKSSGKPILFPKQHFDYVNVKNGVEKFFATVDQYESEIRKNVATFKLDVEETLELALSLPLKRLSVMYDEEVFAYFRNLQIPVIEQNRLSTGQVFVNLPNKTFRLYGSQSRREIEYLTNHRIRGKRKTIVSSQKSNGGVDTPTMIKSR